MKLSLPSVRIVLADMGRVVARFPLVALCAVAGTAASIVATEAQGPTLTNVIMAAALGLPLMFGLRVLRERWASGGVRGQILEACGILLLVGYCRSVPMDFQGHPTMVWMRFVVLDIGLHFAVAFVPCLAGAGEREFWQYNRRLFQRFALAALYSAVLYIGLTLAVASSDKLFSLKIEPRRYGELWIVMAGIFNPLFFLGGVPENWQEVGEDETYPRGIRGFAQFALAPLVIVFVTILYLYSFKIIRAWSWPHGWVALPVCCLAVVGILAALLLQPARAREEERWAKWYWKWFFRALGPLAILLLLSLRERASEYGVTEPRYFGFLIGGWLLALSIYFTARPGGSTRSIPASLALLCLLSVAGPWSAFSVSSASQERKLVELLAPFGAVENGRLVPAKREIPIKAQNAVRSVLTHLLATYGNGRFPELLAGYEATAKGPKHHDLGDRNTYAGVESVIAYLTGAEGPPGTTSRNRIAAPRVSVDLDLEGGLPVEGYRSLYHACVCPGQPPQKLGGLTVQFPAGGAPPKITFGGQPVDVSVVQARLASVAEAGRKGAHRLPPTEMSARLVSGSREWLLIFDKFEAAPKAAGRTEFTELEIYLLEK